MREWIFDGCCRVTRQDRDCFRIEAERDGELRSMIIVPDDPEETESALDAGSCPLDGWEDGTGRSVCWENMEEADRMDEMMLEEMELQIGEALMLIRENGMEQAYNWLLYAHQNLKASMSLKEFLEIRDEEMRTDGAD